MNKDEYEWGRLGDAKWVGRAGVVHNNWEAAVLPAPYFRKSFSLRELAGKAEISICGLGYYELYVNGEKIGDQVLDPVVSQYDDRARFVTHDVSANLRKGENAIGVVLGNGWYNPHTPEVWHFDKAPWSDYPKLLLRLDLEGESTPEIVSDKSWKCSNGPILFDGLRNGETYDARLELGDWSSPGYDDSAWNAVAVVSGPGGVLTRQTMPPCKVTQTIPYVDKWSLNNGDVVFDIGQSMAGWAKITVSGRAGAELILRYSENLDDEKNINQEINAGLIRGGDFQTDRYILKGEGSETWEPRFTFHGFRYVKVSGLSTEVELSALEGRVVRTAFDKIGRFESSDETLNKLQKCAVWSYIGNFVGIPTDCPHREKNGWTGDAQLAAETGLFNFDAGTSYNQWIESFSDVQRPNGELPGIVPSGGWGFNWGSGPAWDSAYILIPWYVYLYTGDDTAIRENYDGMRRYMDYCAEMADDHILSFGLGDWCHVDRERIIPVEITSTGYYHVDALALARFADLMGRADDAEAYARLAKNIKASFNKQFHKGNGLYADGEQTALGCAIYQGLVEDEHLAETAARLADAVKANSKRPDFGILGAKYVPRALSENGYVELAYEMITQREFPGWAHWLEQGATTLWENWNGASSKNHIMFGDISAWMYQYVAGIVPDPEHPGFKRFTLRPNPILQLSWAGATHISKYGEIAVRWERRDGVVVVCGKVPDGTSAVLVAPDGVETELSSGVFEVEI
jgi:alpha-L-rhamnosidase